MALKTVSAGMRDLFVQEWLACTLRTYPDHTGRFLRAERDPFRNPVGHTLRVALGELAAELFGAFDRTRVLASLDAIVRIRAVQDFTPADAVGFVPLARDAARAVADTGDPGPGPGSLDIIDARIDDMARMAADLHARCLDEMHAIGARAARRRDWVMERARARAARRAAAGDGARAACRGDSR